MRNRTRAIAAATAVTAALAAGGTAVAMASTTGAKPGVPAKTMSATKKPGAPAGSPGTSVKKPGTPAGSPGTSVKKPGGSRSAGEQQGHDAIVAVVARELHVSTARVSAALRPMFAAGHADPSSPVFVAAARSLGVSAQQLATALAHGKQSLAGGG